MMDRGLVSDESKIMFVNDGSKDETWNIIKELHIQNDIFSGINLSRNMGHQNALLAGLMTAKDYADMVISLDADLQDDVDVIDKFVEEYYNGSDIVYGVRSSRKTDTFFKRTTALTFYKLMSKLGVESVYNHADYCLMSKRALDGLEQFTEVNLFLRGMVPLIGYKHSIVEYERHERFAGESKYPLKKMLSFALDGITSLSIKPIRIITGLGFTIFLLSIFALIYSIVVKSMGKTIAGWTSLTVSLWMLGGIQLLSLGVIGEYVGKIYNETKQRPRFIISDKLIFPDRIINGNYYNSIFEISGKNIEYRIGSFGKICVCIFMLLSGFGTYKSFIKNKNFIFIKNKLLKFYIIYWICFVVFIPLGYIMGYSRKYNFLEILSNISCYKITYNGEWWFATPFVCIMILSPIILNYLEERKVNSLTFDILMIVTFAVIIRTILPHVIKMDIFSDFIKSSYWRILYSAIKLLPSFLIGCICAKYNLFNKFREGFKSKKIMLLTSFVILIIVFYCRSKSGRSYSWDYIYAPFFIIASTNIINELGIIKKIFVSIGKKSTYMWLIHSFFCYQYFQSFIYSMHNSILILLFLVFITYLTAAVLNELNKYIIVYGKKYFFESRNN